MLTRILSHARHSLFRTPTHDRLLAELFEAESPDRLKTPLFDGLRPLFRTEIETKAVVLKIWNLFLARRNYQARSSFLPSGPVSLVADPANACQLTCPGCVHSPSASPLFDWKPSGLLSETRLEAFLRLYGPAATQMTLYNYGEPLVNPRTPALIRLAKSYFLLTSISTNFSLRRFDADAYVQSGLDFLIVSADGATQGAYEKFRQKGDLAQVTENIGTIVEAKRRLGSSTPVVCWRFLIFEHNRHEVPLAAALAEEAGVDQFRAEAGWDVHWDNASIRTTPAPPVIREFRKSIPALIENWNPCATQAAEHAIEEAFSQEWPPAPRASAASAPSCQWLYKNLTMDAGGRVMPCCCSPRKDGDLLFDQFDGAARADPFNSARHRAARGYFAGEDSELAQTLFCKSCDFDKQSDPTPGQLRAYFTIASRERFSAATLDLLSGW